MIQQYSPYHKTYRYLLFQNQAYHQRNKHNASPQVKSNIRHSMSKISPLKNPQNNFEDIMYRSTVSRSTSRQSNKNLFLADNQIKNVLLDQPKRVIHKHKSFMKFQKKRVNESNSELMNQMIGTKCTVPKKQKTLLSFEKHQKYQQIRTRFSQNGNRRQILSLGNKNLLCPTLAEFMKSGLGDSFLGNLSMRNKKCPQLKQP